MNKMLPYLCFITSLLIVKANGVAAQKIKKEDYFPIDGFVYKSGAMETYSLQYIVDSITKTCTTELQATRAFYYWQATFVAFDTKKHRRPENSLDNASSALMERKAGSKGYAEMFKAMCDLKKIECTVVKGVLRQHADDIGAFDPDAIHYWNIITIDNTQYLVDVSLGAGELDKKGKHFTKKYTDAWWLSNRRLFNLSHFPDNKNQQLLEVPMSKNEFAAAPIVAPAAIVAGVIPSKGTKGLIKGVADSSTALKFNLAGYLRVASMEVRFDNEKPMPVLFDFDQYGFYVTMPNGPEGKHVADLYINQSIAFTFLTDMRKNTRKNKQ